jgi:hypothetical protein
MLFIESKLFFSKYPVKEMKTDKLNVKNMGKLATRLLNTYGLSESYCQNVCFEKYFKTTRYLFYRHFIEKSLLYEPWEELVHSCISEFISLNMDQVQKDQLIVCLFEMLYNHSDAREMCKWAKRLNVNLKILPAHVSKKFYFLTRTTFFTPKLR